MTLWDRILRRCPSPCFCTRHRYERTLETIMSSIRICSNYFHAGQSCDHPICADNYNIWMRAHRALRPPNREGDGYAKYSGEYSVRDGILIYIADLTRCQNAICPHRVKDEGLPNGEGFYCSEACRDHWNEIEPPWIGAVDYDVRWERREQRARQPT